MTTPTAAAGDTQPADQTADLPTEAADATPTTTSEAVPPAGPTPAPEAPSAPDALSAPAAPSAPGQHAAPRPYPPVPPTSSRGVPAETDSLLPQVPAAPATNRGPETTPVTTATPPPEVLGAAATGRPGGDVTPTPPPATERPMPPDLPRRPGAKRHLIGTLLGLLVTPLGLVLAAMGVGHMVDLSAGDGALTDAFGLVLLASGAVVLGLVALLGRWSPAVPITAGVVWGIAGGAVALWDPQGVHDAVHGVTDGRLATIAVDHILDPALNGSLLVLGLVLLGAGISAGLARRAGRSFGTRTVQTELARAEAERLEAAGPAEPARP